MTLALALELGQPIVDAAIMRQHVGILKNRRDRRSVERPTARLTREERDVLAEQGSDETHGVTAALSSTFSPPKGKAARSERNLGDGVGVPAIEARSVKEQGRKKIANERETRGANERRRVLLRECGGDIAMQIAKWRERDLRDGNDATLPSLEDDPPGHVAWRANNRRLQNRKLQLLGAAPRQNTTKPCCES